MLKFLQNAVNPLLDALNPLRSAEGVLSQSFTATTLGEALSVSLVRLRGEYKVVFKLPRDLETGYPNPIVLPPEKLDEMIAFLEECRSRAFTA